MQVTSVSVNVRYSKPMTDGSYKTVELGAEGALDAGDEWQEVQAALYHQLGEQMRYVFSGNGKPQNGSEKPIQPVTATPLPQAPPRQHWCQEHQTAFKKYEKDARAWWSHKAGDGWCKET
jgi:hypothetical protein